MPDKDNILGINGLQAENDVAGVGFVIIPENVDIDLYKEDVYRSGRISIYGGYGHANFYNILIDREALQRVRFPEKSGEMGSPVVWVNMPKHNEPIVVSTLKYDEDFHSLSEFRNRTTHETEGNLVDFDLDAKKGKVTLNIVGNDTTNGEFEVNINSRNGKGGLKIIVNGKTIERVSDSILKISEKQVANVVTNKKGVVVASVQLNSQEKERFTYEDEFGNAVIATEEKFNIRADKSSKIDFGDGAEPVVLAKTLKGILDEYDDAFKKATFPTPMGPTGTRINEAEFKKVRDKFEDFFSKLTNTD
jgi:hypothetical protein